MKYILLSLVATLITTPTLAETLEPVTPKLEARKDAFAKKAAKKRAEAYEKGVQLVAESGVLESALKQGDTAPNFILPNPREESVELAPLLEQGPVIITWYRGNWCPYCNIYLHSLQKALPEFQQHGASLIAISPQTPDKSMDAELKNNLKFHVLSDPENKAAHAFGIAYTLPKIVQEQFKGRLDLSEYSGRDDQVLPLSATYVIKKDGTIAYAFIDPDYRKRAEPASILNALEQLN